MAKVLVVDDKPGVRDVFGECLRDAGHEVSLAADGMEALGLLQTMDIDVVLSDIIMPNLTGMELLKHAHETNEDIQVILMTGQPTVATASAALRDHAFEYLLKPVSGKQICHTVKMAADFKNLIEERRRLDDENQRIRRHLEAMSDEPTAKLEKAHREFLIEIRDRVMAEEAQQNFPALLKKHRDETIQILAKAIERLPQL